MGVIATPLRAAQDVADLLVAAGVRGILNFAPRMLVVPESVALRTMDMAVEFESLSFELSRDRTSRRRRTRDGA
jgi:redox-sensing transcriptional repressor